MNAPESPDEIRQRQAAASRREFLRKALKGATYAAPVIAVLSMRSVAAAQGMASAPHGGGMTMPPMCGGLPGF